MKTIVFMIFQEFKLNFAKQQKKKLKYTCTKMQSGLCQMSTQTTYIYIHICIHIHNCLYVRMYSVCVCLLID